MPFKRYIEQDENAAETDEVEGHATRGKGLERGEADVEVEVEGHAVRGKAIEQSDTTAEAGEVEGHLARVKVEQSDAASEPEADDTEGHRIKFK